MRTLSAALALCAAATGLTGTAHAADSIRAVKCDTTSDYLQIVNDNATHCFAYAGILGVSIHRAYHFRSGNNVARISYTTIHGRDEDLFLQRFQKKVLDLRVEVTRIHIYQ